MTTESTKGSNGKNAQSQSRDNKENSYKCLCLPWLRKNLFLFLLLLFTVAGYALGLGLQSQQLSAQTIYLLGFPGQLMLRAFYMIVVPLLFCSLVLGVSSLRSGGDTRMVVITIVFFLGLSTLSAIMGAAAGHLVHPGRPITTPGEVKSTPQQHSGRKDVVLDSILDLFWNGVPSNVIEATFSKEFTHAEIINSTDEDGNSNSTMIVKKKMMKKSGVNFMGLLSFSILFGCALASLGPRGDALHKVMEQLNDVVMKMMGYFVTLLPGGLFFWMIREGLENSAPLQMFQYMGIFLLTAMCCILFHQLVLLPTLYLTIVRKNPLRYHLNLMPAILTAFGTSSSAATLPVTVQCADGPNRLNRCVSRFVLPLGMVVHMNGGTFYVTLSSIFLAQLEGLEVGAGETAVLCLTCILLFISAPGTAGGGNPVYMLTAMATIGIERPQYLSLVISIDWLMERFRTVMNVVADSYVAAIVEKLCGNRLPLDYAEDMEYETPVIEGYDLENTTVDATSVQNRGNVCGCCGKVLPEVTVA